MEFAPRSPIPVFPLPDLVLFPGAVAGLHVFELRYRAMVQDALRGDRHIVMTLLKPGWEHDYHGSPDFHPLGCLARFQEVQWLPDDCYDLRVVGVKRVRVVRVVREYPYRTASVSVLPQEPLPEQDPLVELERRALMDAWSRAQGTTDRAKALDGCGRLEEVVNAACMALDLTPASKLALLGMDSLLERSRWVREVLERRLRQGSGRSSGTGEHN